ncbi:carbamoyl phosphate synthase small subunit [Bacillus fonticola]|uniref:carbamoyl phosphate synthase small subunit n=1 Tax=Bacillus fonticola TaxID=2728853 RepID=UPI001475E67B|nr:carbamoyl phosphate synthase small subunit [Bacillus fonticola]
MTMFVLEDGTVYENETLGKIHTPIIGEVVFQTSMTGYQEVLTDPSYAGQIIVMTSPMIGNVGVSKEDSESARPFAKGIIVKKLHRTPAYWRQVESFGQFLSSHNVMISEGMDTRALVRKLRTKGVMMGGWFPEGTSVEDALYKLQAYKGEELVRSVSTPSPYTIPGKGHHVVVVDFGVKRNILTCLQEAGCQVTVVPYHTSSKEILAYAPNGVLLSNGPGDPKDVDEVLPMIQDLTARLPVFGICLGHQLLARAFGGDTEKLLFGHRGANHPVKDERTGQMWMTSQNHGYAVVSSPELLQQFDVSYTALHDGTVEGLIHKTNPVTSVQFHPEASPGPHDAAPCFEPFFKQMNDRRTSKQPVLQGGNTNAKA